MKLIDAVLLAVAIATFSIGVHQSYYFGIAKSYDIFMLSIACLLLLRWFKQRRAEKAGNS